MIIRSLLFKWLLQLFYKLIKVNHYATPIGITFEEDEMLPLRTLEFEGFPVRVFKNYDKYLKSFYGNYMKLPLENERYPHEGKIDPFKPCKHKEVLYWDKDAHVLGLELVAKDWRTEDKKNSQKQDMTQEQCEIINLKNGSETIRFYDDRYCKGYMEEWPIGKKQRIFELIRGLNLPEMGDVIDFGCGNGEFTGVLRQVLPRWNIYGVDISSIAIENAQKRHRDCSFFLTSDMRLKNKKFDFLFSHHVLEHVDDIDESWSEIDRYLKKQSSILHVLPCGNQGSFEYNLCMQRIDGVKRKSQEKFVFEDNSHLRRLTTTQMNDFAAQYNFELVFGYYSNQFYGALDWITLLSPYLIFDMVNPRKAKDKIAALKSACLCIALVLIKLIRFPANTIEYQKGRMEKYKYYSLFLILLLFYPLSKLINMYLAYMSNSEWRANRCKENGSEMYLYYKRKQII